jgi:hypothetical protein
LYIRINKTDILSKNKNTMDRSNGGFCDGFLSTAILVNEKSLNTKFGGNHTYNDQVMLWTSL